MVPETLIAALTYEPVTGDLRWKTGATAGSMSWDGYIRLGHRKKTYAAHRVAWLLMTGEWPPLQIDHINLNKSDNRWENLRLATPTQNNANQRGKGNFPKGVTRHRTGRLQAQIKKAGRNYYLGLFDTPDAAHAAYCEAAAKLFGEFARTA